jgi:hypothetical protein
MAQHLYFTRDTKVFVVVGGLSGGTAWEIPVLDGFSFSQATTASDIVLAEMESAGGVSRRGKRTFNDALAPAEWSFSTYTRPYLASAALGSQVHAVEEVLWALMAGPAQYDSGTYSFHDGNPTTGTYFTWSDANNLEIDWSTSNVSELGTASIVFQVGDSSPKWYELTSSVVNEASVDFDIDGIAMINWSGFGARLREINDPTGGWTLINESVTSTNNFIRNRLTQLTIAPNQASYNTDELEDTYDITLTGGNITISNNISYITPEELGIVNYPIGHVTGNRSVSGNFTAYIVYDDDVGSANETADFWSDMANLTSVVTHDFALTFNVGGATGDPRVAFAMPHAHMEIPTHSIEDIISVECNFSGLPSSIDDTDETSVAYYSTLTAA